MTWEDRNGQKYYYRRRRVDGRVKAEYLGRGPFPETLARLDEAERERALLHAERMKQLRAIDQAIDREVRDATQQIQQLASILLEDEGLHQPKGTWRRKR